MMVYIVIIECSFTKFPASARLYSRRYDMKKAVWNGTVLAESDETVMVEGFAYFPPESLHREYFQASDTRTTCPRKGAASYFDIVVEGKVNKDAAWTYPDPKEAAKHIRGWMAFWKGVQVIEE
jgi:uncharacterized protein (DUF427 family)